MTNPFQSISEPNGQKSFEEALSAFTAKPHAASNGATNEPLADGGEQSSGIETGIGVLSTSYATHPLPRPPLGGGIYEPAAALRLMNAYFFIGKDNQEIGVYRVNDDGSVTYMPADQFKLAVQNIFVEVKAGGKTTLVSAEKFWKESQGRREKGIVFKPSGNTQPNEYNLWRGFGVEPRKGWQKQLRLLRHIFEVICRRDKAKFRYLTRWLAWAVQNPDKQAGTVIVLKSRKQATGKSTLGTVMQIIFGSHGAIIDDSDRLLGRFNDWQEVVSFILAEEILWAGDHKTADKLKSRITADWVQIERKGGAIRLVANLLHMIMTTNHDHAIGAGVGDRRFVVFDVSDEHANDKSWFTPLYRDLGHGGTSEFLYLLQNLRLGDWHPRQILKTTETIEQQRMSGDSVSQWAQACVEADALVGGVGTHDLGGPIAAQTLQEAYNGFCRQNGQRALGTAAFGKACGQMFDERKRLKALQSSSGKGKRRPWGYYVPKGRKWQEKVDARLGIKN